MKHDFLISPQLNQAFESEGSSGVGWGNGITRRSFIKRTGGATVASLVAWNVTTTKSRAEEDGEGSGSVSWKMDMVDASPELSDSSIAINSCVVDIGGVNYSLRIAIEGDWTYQGAPPPPPTTGINSYAYYARFRVSFGYKLESSNENYTAAIVKDCDYGVVIECDERDGAISAGYSEIDIDGNPIEHTPLPPKVHEYTIAGEKFLFDYDVTGSTVPLSGGECTLLMTFEGSAQLSDSSGGSLLVLPISESEQVSKVVTNWKSYFVID